MSDFKPIVLINDTEDIATKVPVFLIAVMDRLCHDMHASRSILLRAGLYLLFTRLSVTENGHIVGGDEVIQALVDSMTPIGFSPPNSELLTVHYFGDKNDERPNDDLPSAPLDRDEPIYQG